MTGLLALLLLIEPASTSGAAPVGASPLSLVDDDSGGGDDDENPLAAPDDPAPAPDDPAPAPDDPAPAADDPAPATSDAAPADTAGDVDADAGSSDEPDPHLGLRLSAGLGMMLRAFDPGPATLTRYRSTPVGAVRFAIAVAPTPSTELTVTADRSLGMSTAIQDESAATASSRWEVAASIQGHLGDVGLAPVVGAGRRRFSVESTSMLRSPDGDYAYVTLGGRLEAPLGPRALLRLTAAFEPVYGGDQPTEMAFGPAQRWGLTVGGALAVHVSRHLGIGFDVDYQRFAWSWTKAGSRGAGGAIDHYPSAIMTLAADY